MSISSTDLTNLEFELYLLQTGSELRRTKQEEPRSKPSLNQLKNEHKSNENNSFPEIEEICLELWTFVMNGDYDRVIQHPYAIEKVYRRHFANEKSDSWISEVRKD